MVNPVTYLQEVNREMRRVTWPSRNKTVNMTGLVIGVSIIIAAIIAGADLVFQRAIALLLG